MQGSAKILEKFQVSAMVYSSVLTPSHTSLPLQSLTFQKISRIITTIDAQPMFDGGVLINVLGRLQCDEDPPHAYSQVFLLKPLDGSFYCAHDIFRLNIHDTA